MFVMLHMGIRLEFQNAVIRNDEEFSSFIVRS